MILSIQASLLSAPSTLPPDLADLSRELEKDLENRGLQNQFVTKAQEACREGRWDLLKPYALLVQTCRNFEGETLLAWAERSLKSNASGSIQIFQEVYSLIANSDPLFERLAQKIATDGVSLSRAPKVNWMQARVFTPGGLYGYRDADGLKLLSCDDETGVKLYRLGKNSQGLILQDEQVVGASVWSGIKTKTQRKNEKKGTYVQYDKTRVEQEDVDFEVDPENYRGWVNYQGGHLIDHKYSAENSHTDSQNYIPAHYFYNAPLKEYLVKRCDAYVEIPLYTPNPPRIGVKGDLGTSHPIPVGVIFVQISDQQIDAAYYFPNNDFDYKGLKDSLGIRKNLAATMAAYFKLKPCFHELLRPAIITNWHTVENGQIKQSTCEETFFCALSTVCHGMSLAECEEDEAIISRLSFGIFHEDGAVDPALCLACGKEEFDNIEDQPLAAPFRALGEFLVRYGIKNALKSEVISVKSRLVFANVIIDFIEANSQVSEEALEFVDTLAEEFKAALAELDRIRHTMNLEDLIYFANTYQRLASEFNHPFSLEDHEIYGDMDLVNYFKKSMEVLNRIVSNHSVDEFDTDLGMNLVHFITEAKTILRYLIDTGFEKEEFRKESALLKKVRPYAQKLLAQQDSDDGTIDVEFQTSIERATLLKTSVGYLESVLENL